MYKTAALLYLTGLIIYILFSRVPDYSDAEFTPGKILQPRSFQKQIQFKVGKESYIVAIGGWGASQVAAGQSITVIYNPSNPTEANLYTFFSYWFTLNELLISAVGFIILFAASVIITGKNNEESNNLLEPVRKRKYND